MNQYNEVPSKMLCLTKANSGTDVNADFEFFFQSQKINVLLRLAHRNDAKILTSELLLWSGLHKNTTKRE